MQWFEKQPEEMKYIKPFIEAAYTSAGKLNWDNADLSIAPMIRTVVEHKGRDYMYRRIPTLLHFIIIFPTYIKQFTENIRNRLQELVEQRRAGALVDDDDVGVLKDAWATLKNMSHVYGALIGVDGDEIMRRLDAPSYGEIFAVGASDQRFHMYWRENPDDDEDEGA